MSPGALAIMFVKSAGEIAGATFFALVYLLFGSRGSGDSAVVRFAVAAAVIFVYAFIVAFVRYYFRKFHIEGDKLIYTHGLARKVTTSIPLSRVHTLRTKMGLLYRLLNMRGVSFDTLATDSSEVELILDERDWQMLLRRVSRGEDHPDLTDEDAATTALPPPLTDETLHISNLNILKGALCQNHLRGFAVLATLALALFDKFNQLDEDTTTRIIDYIGNRADHFMPTAGQCLIFIAVTYLIVMLLWTGKIALRYGDMSLRMADSRLTVESGLVTRFTSRLAREKITILTIKRNPLEKLARCETVTLRQARNVTDTKADDGISIYGCRLGHRLLHWWLGADADVPASPLLSARSGPGMMWRRFLPQLLPAAALAAAVILAGGAVVTAAALSVAYTAIALMRAVMAWRHSSIRLHAAYILITGGNIARIRHYIRYRDIESVGITCTPLTPYTGRVTLRIATNAGHVTVPSLLLRSALTLRRHLLFPLKDNSLEL